MNIKIAIFKSLNTDHYRTVLLCVLVLLLASTVNASPSWTAKTAAGHFQVSLQPQASQYSIGEYHNWILRLKDEDGQPVANARLALSGGMIGHGHGMPSKPAISATKQAGEYLIEGMLFSMVGDWTLVITVQTPDHQDTARFDIELVF